MDLTTFAQAADTLLTCKTGKKHNIIQNIYLEELNCGNKYCNRAIAVLCKRYTAFNFSRINGDSVEKGKTAERQRRKATGLNRVSCRAAGPPNGTWVLTKDKALCSQLTRWNRKAYFFFQDSLQVKP